MAKAKTLALISVALGTLATAAAAQPTSLQRASAQDAPKTRRIDGVLGILKDTAILESSISSELRAQVEGARNAGRQVTKAMQDRWRHEILEDRLNAEALAQGARTMPGATREQVERVVDQKMEEFVRQEELKAGGVSQLTQQLGFIGRTLESIETDHRTRLMGELAHQHYLSRRYQDSWALAVTPTEMRRFYRENRAQFVSEASADLEIVAIPGGSNAEEALAKAHQLSESWRTTAQPAAGIAGEFSGVALDPRRRVRDTDDDHHAAEIKAFAASAKQGDVSEPIQRGSSYWVLRATAVYAARRGLFEDPKIQSLIQRQLALDLINQDRAELIRAQRKKVRYVTTRRRSR